MGWNHRVIVRRYDGLNEFEFDFGLHEVYYNDDGSIYLWTEKRIAPTGETVDELRETLEWMLRALDKPVLREEGDTLVEDEGERRHEHEIVIRKQPKASV